MSRDWVGPPVRLGPTEAGFPTRPSKGVVGAAPIEGRRSSNRDQPPGGSPWTFSGSWGTLDLRPRPPRSSWGQLEGAVERTLRYFVERPPQAALGKVLVQVYLHPDFKDELANVRSQTQAFFLRKIEEGLKLGAVRDDVPASYLAAVILPILESTDVWITSHWEELGKGGIDKVPGMILAMVRRVVEPLSKEPVAGAPRSRRTR